MTSQGIQTDRSYFLSVASIKKRRQEGKKTAETFRGVHTSAYPIIDYSKKTHNNPRGRTRFAQESTPLEAARSDVSIINLEDKSQRVIKVRRSRPGYFRPS
jgi:hypothetical protein